jgi:hypothetical protein
LLFVRALFTRYASYAAAPQCRTPPGFGLNTGVLTPPRLW